MRQTATLEMGGRRVRRARRNIPAHRRYSRLIELLRYLLPALALSLVALVAAWPQLMGAAGGLIVPIFANGEIDGADVMLMHNPRYVGRTKNDEPYELTATSAYADPKQPNRIKLDHPAGALTSDGPRDLNLVARSGLYDRAAAKLDLMQGVELTTSDGYRFDTERAHINLKDGGVIGEQPIQGSGPTGTLSADRFEIRDKGDLLHFEGRVKVTLPPRGVRQEAS
jgi:lipopolysaccharide export system protein LptC